MLTRRLLIAIREWIEIDLQIRTNSYSATLNLQGSTHSFLFLSFFWIVWESASYRVVAKNEKNITNYCFNFSFSSQILLSSKAELLQLKPHPFTYLREKFD